MNNRRRYRPGPLCFLLVVSWFALLGWPGPSLSQPAGGRSGPSDAEEAANGQRVSEIVTANSAPV